MFCGILVLLSFNLALGLNMELNTINLPEDILSYLLGCSARVSRTMNPQSQDQDPLTTRNTRENLEMIDVDKMREDLKQTISNEEMINQIISQVEKTMEEHKSGRQGCTQVTIDVPPQEVKGLNEQIYSVVQQNNRLLLEQINTLFRLKMDQLYEKFEKAIDEKLSQLSSSPSAMRENQDSMQTNIEKMTPEDQSLMKKGEVQLNLKSEQPQQAEDTPMETEQALGQGDPSTDDALSPLEALRSRPIMPLISGRPSDVKVENHRVKKMKSGRKTGGISRLRDLLRRRKNLNAEKSG